MIESPVDLLLVGGHLIDPSTGLDRIASIAFADGLVAAIDPPSCGARRVVDVAGRIVTPGLIDFHTHVYHGGTSLGLEPDALASTSAATTLVDAGSAGAANILGFRKSIDAARVDVLAFINISYAGIFGFSDKGASVGENFDIRLLKADACIEAAREHRDFVVGIKVRVGPNSSGPNTIAPLEIALQAAEELGLPVMAHMENPPPTHRSILSLLRAGDILTHSCRAFPNSLASAGGTVIEEAREARDRGVVFDLGHGRGSFSFESLRRLHAAGFDPDVISSDAHRFNQSLGVDLVSTMSKCLAAGMTLRQVITATTLTPARLLRRPDAGSLAVGSAGDASVLSVERGRFEMHDTTGACVTADQRVTAVHAVRKGFWSS